MDQNQRDVIKFMLASGRKPQQLPSAILHDEFDKLLCIDLIRSEFEELRIAMGLEDIVEIADALADLQYVITWCACVYGVDLRECFKEVQRSNMTKTIGGCAIDRSGKIMKGSNYDPPHLAEILVNQEPIYQSKEVAE